MSKTKHISFFAILSLLVQLLAPTNYLATTMAAPIEYTNPTVSGGIVSSQHSIPIPWRGYDTFPALQSDGSYVMLKKQKWQSDLNDIVNETEGVLKISKGGLVRATKTGTATLSITGEPSMKIRVISATLSNKHMTMSVGQEKQLTLTSGLGDLSANNIPVDWQSTNQNVAQVYKGAVRAVGPGVTIVQAVAGGVVYKCRVKVNADNIEPLVTNVGVGKKVAMRTKNGETWENATSTWCRLPCKLKESWKLCVCWKRGRF